METSHSRRYQIKKMLHCAAGATRWCSLYPYQLLRYLFALNIHYFPNFWLSVGQGSLETHFPFNGLCNTEVYSAPILKASEYLLFQHVKWHKSWEINKFHHSEEVIWIKEVLDREQELLLPAGNPGCALAADCHRHEKPCSSSYTCS